MTASVEHGGAWYLIDRLAKIYVAPDFTFPAPESEDGTSSATPSTGSAE